MFFCVAWIWATSAITKNANCFGNDRQKLDYILANIRHFKKVTNWIIWLVYPPWLYYKPVWIDQSSSFPSNRPTKYISNDYCYHQEKKKKRVSAYLKIRKWVTIFVCQVNPCFPSTRYMIVSWAGKRRSHAFFEFIFFGDA